MNKKEKLAQKMEDAINSIDEYVEEAKKEVMQREIKRLQSVIEKIEIEMKRNPNFGKYEEGVIYGLNCAKSKLEEAFNNPLIY